MIITFLFFVEFIVYILALFRKTLKAASLVQFLLSPIAMIILLIGVLLSAHSTDPLPFILAISIGIAIKIGIVVFYRFNYKRGNDAISYAKFYNGLCSVVYALNLLSAFISAYLISPSAMALLAIPVGINIASSFAVAYFATVFLISAFVGKALGIKEKIVAVRRFFTKYELSFFFSEFYSTIMMVIAYCHVNDNHYYFFLGLFYSLLVLAKLITFLWNKRLEKKEKDPLLLSKKKHRILLFNSIFFLAAGNLMSISALLLSALKASQNLPAWFFIGFMFPFSILNFILCLVQRHEAKKGDNAYYDARVDQSLITSLFSFLAGLTYFFKYIPDSNVSGLIWILLWVLMMVFITVTLIRSFVRSIIGMRGRRKTQRRASDAESES